MKRRLALLLVLIVALTVVAAAPAQAEAPAENWFMSIYMVPPGAPCSDVTWFGTVELEGDTYGMALRTTGEPGVTLGQSYHYKEYNTVYTGFFEVDEATGFLLDCDPGEVVLHGYSEGSSSMPNAKFHANGVVEEAFGPFAGWEGRRIHDSGLLTDFVVIPDVGPFPTAYTGYFRVNGV
jgi:hypothetical protein